MKKNKDIGPKNDMEAINDELFAALVKRAAHDYIVHDLMEDINLEEDFTPSPEFDARMRGIINKALRKEKRARARKVLLKVAACFAVFLVLSTAVVFSAEALRVKFLNFLIEADDNMASIDFIGNRSGKSNEIPCIPSYMTDGYELTRVEDYDIVVVQTYENQKGDAFTISVYSGNPSIVMDTEDAEHGPLTIKGQEAYYSLADGVTMIVFKDENHVYFLQGTIPLDEAVKIAENINN